MDLDLESAAEEDDLDFVLDQPLDQPLPQEELAPDSEEQAMDLDLESAAQEDDLDFVLDQPLDQPLPQEEQAAAQEEQAMDLDLESAAEEDDLDFVLDQPPAQEEQAPDLDLEMDWDDLPESDPTLQELPPASPFDLDDFLDTDEQPTEDAFELDEEEAVDTEIDFDLQEVVVETPEIPEAELEIEDLAPSLDDFAVSEQSTPEPPLSETSDVTQVTGPTPETASEALNDTGEPAGMPTAPTADQEPALAPLSDEHLERIEALVDQAVRETVSRVLERILPRIIDEVVTRELEKIRDELE